MAAANAAPERAVRRQDFLVRGGPSIGDLADHGGFKALVTRGPHLRGTGHTHGGDAQRPKDREFGGRLVVGPRYGRMDPGNEARRSAGSLPRDGGEMLAGSR